MSHEAIIEKVRKLMATASDAAATANEAAVALRLAQRLMAAHRISADDVSTAQQTITGLADVKVENMVSDVLGPFTTGQQRIDGWLAVAAGKVCSVGVYFHVTQRVVYAYGLARDIAVARALYGWLLSHSKKLARDWSRERNLGVASTKSFRLGFASELRDRAVQAHQQALVAPSAAEVTTATGALVVVDERAIAVQHATALAQKKAQLNLGVARMSRRPARDALALQAGRAAARFVNLRRDVLG